MNIKITIVTALCLIYLTGCGPSAAEVAARTRFIADSAVEATAQSIKREKEIQDSIANVQAYQAELKQQLIDLRAQLEAAEVKLNDTEQFKFLRTADEKKQQIEEQTRIVEALKLQIAEIEKQIL